MGNLECRDSLIDLIHEFVSEGRYSEAQEIAGYVRNQHIQKRTTATNSRANKKVGVKARNL